MPNSAPAKRKVRRVQIAPFSTNQGEELQFIPDLHILDDATQEIVGTVAPAQRVEGKTSVSLIQLRNLLLMGERERALGLTLDALRQAWAHAERLKVRGGRKDS